MVFWMTGMVRRTLDKADSMAGRMTGCAAVCMGGILLLSGCGTGNTSTAGNLENKGDAVAEQTESVEESTEHFSVEQELEEMFLAAEEDTIASTLEVVYAEEEMYPELAQFLAEYYQIPEEDWEQTRYYYNYIDLNEDGTDEIFVVVLTDFTRGNPGGSPALILEQDDAGVFTVLESFEEIATPVMVSSNVTNGWRDIILDCYGLKDGDGYLICHYEPEIGYQGKNNELVDTLEPEPCTQILSNNLIDDMDQGRYLTLAGKHEEKPAE